MNIRNIRIGDRLQPKTTRFPMQVTALFTNIHDPTDKGTIYLDFAENQGDPYEFDPEELEPATE
ncbi:MAG: hypothetical protein HUK20_13250 [Fibrobacter sp.]|nr:hypothetical protein [Fibrobacter sp.]